MSLNFTQITTLIDTEASSNSTSYPLASKVLDINLALDDAIDIAIRTCGIGQYDDNNHTNYPTITTDINLGQRDYTYTQDQNANLVLDIYKVMFNGKEIPQVDMQSGNYPTFYDNTNTTGTPTCYDRTGNGIIFDVIPNANITDGLKMFINREGSYFTVSDTTKKPGIDPRVHEYLVISPAFKHAERNDLANKGGLERRKLILEEKIRRVYANKDRGIRRQIKPNYQNNK